MATVTDPNIKPKPAIWQVVLNIIYSALGTLKAMGKFSKGAGPAMILVAALSGGCALNAEVRYPWDKQKDKQEVVAKSEVKAVIIDGDDSFDPTPSAGQIAMAKKAKEWKARK